MPAAVTPALQTYLADPASGQPQAVLDGLNALVSGPSLYDQALFAAVSLSAGTLALVGQAATLGPAQLAVLNRTLLDESFPVALGVAAVAVADATMQLTRVTVLGRTAAHRLQTSDSILGDFTAVDDVQDGGVRYSAYASGSAIPRQYASAAIPPGAPIFTSSSYGAPGLRPAARDRRCGDHRRRRRRVDLLWCRERLGDGRLLADLNPLQGAGPADQVRRVHAARAHAGDRPCHMSISRTGKRGTAHGRRLRTS